MDRASGARWGASAKPLVGRYSPQDRPLNQRLHVGRLCCHDRRPAPHRRVPCPAAGRLRRQLRSPRGSLALGPFRQAVLVLRRFRERGCVHCLARDTGVSRATGYRYLHEVLDTADGKA
jgi:hypothetical protein